MKENGLVIAIDGPAASGKSTTARLVANELGYTYIDTGAMYRAVTLAAVRAGIDPDDQSAIELLASTLDVRIKPAGDGLLHTYLGDEEISKEIRSPRVNEHVSQISAYPGVRKAMVALQMDMGRNGGVVLDGRDIGTVVFPDADVKIFMFADISARAQRRQVDLDRSGSAMEVDTVAHDLSARDEYDSSRAISPMRAADDAIQIDTSDLTIDQQVEQVLHLVDEKMAELGVRR